MLHSIPPPPPLEMYLKDTDVHTPSMFENKQACKTEMTISCMGTL